MRTGRVGTGKNLIAPQRTGSTMACKKLCTCCLPAHSVSLISKIVAVVRLRGISGYLQFWLYQLTFSHAPNVHVPALRT